MRHAQQDYTRADLPPRARALCDYAVKLTRRPTEIGEPDLTPLREHGLSDRDMHDAVQVISYFNYINRVADALGTDPEPEW